MTDVPFDFQPHELQLFEEAYSHDPVWQGIRSTVEEHVGQGLNCIPFTNYQLDQIQELCRRRLTDLHAAREHWSSLLECSDLNQLTSEQAAALLPFVALSIEDTGRHNTIDVGPAAGNPEAVAEIVATWNEDWRALQRAVEARAAGRSMEPLSEHDMDRIRRLCRVESERMLNATRSWEAVMTRLSQV